MNMVLKRRQYSVMERVCRLLVNPGKGISISLRPLQAADEGVADEAPDQLAGGDEPDSPVSPPVHPAIPGVSPMMSEAALFLPAHCVSLKR